MLRVFIVDDDDNVRQNLRNAVPWHQCGFVLSGEAGDGEQALPLIRQLKPDVLIADVQMPYMGGLALSKLVRQEFPGMKIILTSSIPDFDSAQKAVSLGVEDYLLKPLTNKGLISALNNVKDRIEAETQKKENISFYHKESNEYSRFLQGVFFDRIVTGQLSIQEIYERAQELEINLNAESYSVAFFSIPQELSEYTEFENSPHERIRENLLTHFLKYPDYILFKWNSRSYAALIMGDTDKINQNIERCIQVVRQQYETHAPDYNWYFAVASPVQRLSQLPECYREAEMLRSYQHILRNQHIFTKDTVSFLTGTGSNECLADLKMEMIDTSLVERFLKSATTKQVPDYVDDYLKSFDNVLESKPFCHYLMLSVYFTAISYLQKREISPKVFRQRLNCMNLLGMNVTYAQLKSFLSDILLRAVELKEESAGDQYRSVLRHALDYLDDNFTDSNLTLQTVADHVSISPNHLSAVFSKEMGTTFSKYLSGKRLEYAKELLRNTDLRSGEVANAVGIEDPGYFSVVFKKAFNCTPREYRAKKHK